ncbi:MAG: UDP-N-acetylmuramate dehydrogenase [Bacteroidetes bacterium]|nr:UDP-N-acetylmuramate dehydrogenase [Bacteroidota bacterium]
MPDFLLRKNASLRELNTFGFDQTAEALLEVTEAEQLTDIYEDARLPRPFHVLGGGSNVLLTGPVLGTVLMNRIKGIELISEDDDIVRVRVGGGVVWHDWVLFAIAQGWCGVENLALIPGTVGAAPIQNIGAYGVEVKDVIDEVVAWHGALGKFIRLSALECRFGYRDSIFKQELKGEVFVTEVCFRLRKHAQLHTEYGAIREELQAMDAEPSVEQVAQAVIRIRRSKLPDPAQIGNAGSFFKNPVIDASLFESLLQRFSNMPSYAQPDGMVKLPAGWLIEHCGWKGFRDRDVGVHTRQALVLVNYGHATGAEIWNLSERIIASVQERFGIVLEREVQVW